MPVYGSPSRRGFGGFTRPPGSAPWLRHRTHAPRTRSYPISSLHSLSCCLGAHICGASAISLKHHVRGPSGEPFQVALLSPIHQEVVCECMPELVWVQV